MDEERPDQNSTPLSREHLRRRRADDSNALQDVVNALGSDNPGFQPSCAAVGPLIGNA